MTRVAIVHDWLISYAGAERVLEQLLLIYPDADVFTICDFMSESDRRFLNGHKITTSFIQKMPWARKRYRHYLPLMPLAIEQFDLSGYDIVISSSHAVAKGVITGPDQLHISYVHTPIRYAWDFQHQYLRESGLEKGMKSWLARMMLHRIRRWDLGTSNGVDVFIANSAYIGRRIRKVYRRESQVIYPPVNINMFTPCEDRGDYYLTTSRMVPYKRVDLIVKAFATMPSRRLVVIGTGPDSEKIKALASGHDNVTIIGYQPSDVLVNHMRRAKAFVFAAEEDFGITPVEAQACGTPVIAYGKGGSAETVRGLDRDGPTGILFATQSVESVVEAVDEFESSRDRFSASQCRQNALFFSEANFVDSFKIMVERERRSFKDSENVINR